MKKLKIGLDIIMAITLIFVMSIKFTGNKIHELLGILFIVEFLIHKILNLKTIKILLKQFLKPKVKKSLKFGVLIDFGVVFLMLISSISGLIISKYIFCVLNNPPVYWNKIHNISSYLAVTFVLIHILLHKKYIIISINNIFKLKYNKIAEKIFNVILIICFIIIVYLFGSNVIKQKKNKKNNLNKQNLIEIRKNIL